MTDANNCYKILNIDIPPLKGSFDDIDPRKQWDEATQDWSTRVESKVDTTFLNPDLINFLSNNNQDQHIQPILTEVSMIISNTNLQL